MTPRHRTSFAENDKTPVAPRTGSATETRVRLWRFAVDIYVRARDKRARSAAPPAESPVTERRGFPPRTAASTAAGRAFPAPVRPASRSPARRRHDGVATTAPYRSRATTTSPSPSRRLSPSIVGGRRSMPFANRRRERRSVTGRLYRYAPVIVVTPDYGISTRLFRFASASRIRCALSRRRSLRVRRAGPAGRTPFSTLYHHRNMCGYSIVAYFMTARRNWDAVVKARR